MKIRLQSRIDGGFTPVNMKGKPLLKFIINDINSLAHIGGGIFEWTKSKK